LETALAQRWEHDQVLLDQLTAKLEHLDTDVDEFIESEWEALALVEG
jgi:hypothetical protein